MLCWYQILDLISSIHFQRYILENIMKCRHFLVGILPRMREPTLLPFLYFRVFYSVVDCEIIVEWNKLKSKRYIYMFYTLSGFSKSSWERLQEFSFRSANRENHRMRIQPASPVCFAQCKVVLKTSNFLKGAEMALQ